MVEILCSVVMDNVMPSIRASIAMRMLDKGIKQAKISEKLKLTQPAISKYKHGMRGGMFNSMKKNEYMQPYIDGLFRDIAYNGVDLYTKTCEVCRAATKSGLIPSSNGTFLKLCELSKLK